jgi:hypothetical protein
VKAKAKKAMLSAMEYPHWIISSGQPAKLAPASLSTDAKAGPAISAA